MIQATSHSSFEIRHSSFAKITANKPTGTPRTPLAALDDYLATLLNFRKPHASMGRRSRKGLVNEICTSARIGNQRACASARRLHRPIQAVRLANCRRAGRGRGGGPDRLLSHGL